MKLELGQRSIIQIIYLCHVQYYVKQLTADCGQPRISMAKASLTFDNREAELLNHNHINIFKYDWLSTALVAAFNRTMQ